ncbi:MAG: metalloregulator ArsR/SmtB family transcription factor [bacterium]
MNKYKNICEVLKALAHPARLEIVHGLKKDECNVSEIQKKLGLPQSTISQHLKILKNAGIIVGRREGIRVCYKVVNQYAKKIIKMTE